jgi:hypothetical protein
MSLTTCMPFRAKVNFLSGAHAAADTYKMALVKVGHAGTYNNTFDGVGTPGSGAPSVTNLGTDEVGASGTYAAGGATLATYTPGNNGTTEAWIDWTTDPSWTTATISAVGAIIYNDTDAGKPAVGLYDFGGTVSSTAGTFTVTLPAAGAGTAVVRIS